MTAPGGRRRAVRARGAGGGTTGGFGGLGDRGALALWIPLAVLAAARALSAATRGMALWGLDAQRFLPPAWGWLPWFALALALLPAVGRALAPPPAALRGGVSGHPRVAAAG